jgi:hypothetical protein
MKRHFGALLWATDADRPRLEPQQQPRKLSRPMRAGRDGCGTERLLAAQCTWHLVSPPVSVAPCTGRLAPHDVNTRSESNYQLTAG